MRRRQLMAAGLGLGGATLLPGRVSSHWADRVSSRSMDRLSPAESSNRTVDQRADDEPAYGDWIPEENHDDPDLGVYFTHADWEAISALDDGENPADDDHAFTELFDRLPIVGLPLFGARLSLLAPFWMISFPFSADLLTDEDTAVDGIETESVTWTIDTVVYHGDFDPDVFATEYADDFEQTGERDEFVVYEGADEFTGGLSYAVSPETLLVGLQPEEPADPEESPDRVGADTVAIALEEYEDETDRMIDSTDGAWLFDSTGEGQMAFGGWEVDALREALEPEDDPSGDTGGPTAAIDLEDHPVFEPVESLVNTIRFDVEDGTMGAVEASFAGLYPDDAVPDEDEIETHLIGDAAAPHEITIDENRLYATATFDDLDTGGVRSADLR